MGRDGYGEEPQMNTDGDRRGSFPQISADHRRWGDGEGMFNRRLGKGGSKLERPLLP